MWEILDLFLLRNKKNQKLNKILIKILKTKLKLINKAAIK